MKESVTVNSVHSLEMYLFHIWWLEVKYSSELYLRPGTQTEFNCVFIYCRFRDSTEKSSLPLLMDNTPLTPPRGNPTWSIIQSVARNFIRRQKDSGQ